MNSQLVFIGIDIGAAGGWAMLDAAGQVLAVEKTPPTDADLMGLITDWMRARPDATWHAQVEKVGASPQMGVSSAFSFGHTYGATLMALAFAGIPYDLVPPLKWQRRMDCLSGGDKNVTKERAQQLFPGVKVTHAIADALLIAEYGRRTRLVDQT